MKKNLFILVAFISISATIFSQIPPPGGANLPPDGIPIDGGLGMLLAGLAAYGAKKFWKKK